MGFKRRKKNVNNEYGNCKFILGSSAVFERLWSMANNFLDGNWSRTSPLLTESLLFLCQNRRYCGIEIVQKAYQVTCSERVKNKMAEDEGYNEINN